MKGRKNKQKKLFPLKEQKGFHQFLQNNFGFHSCQISGGMLYMCIYSFLYASDFKWKRWFKIHLKC